MRYYSEDVVDRIIDDAIQYGIDIDAGGTGERPFASHYPSVDSNWHTGTPTEGGLYFVYEKYVGYAKRKLPTKISKKELEDSFYNVIAWQKIEPYKETDNG